ncbi:Gfo/Idh/MocA family oxidoreductase [Microbacterium sp. YMB-B2]|uniref:Gfo/Idh/MocA family oxidoreductase n=1 Tax=Microbacterium tenebrionis TaxID=2830665 RepID=A0A9X1RZW5_9MICO|nr:Gfo/Idh/MocA family oxidoreductase [Microbacterium tenebrionis]MCC2028635.1 Gfo/Idh/MocA family oxidoreductase [Microbacterium tenebrionis]
MVIRTAIIGFGTAGGLFHAPFLAADPAFRIDAIVTRDPARVERATSEHPQARILADTAALWEMTDSIDLVVVASPSGSHAAHAESALRAGYHVVVDKPFVADAETGETLIAIAAARDLMLTVFQNRRWDGDFLTVSDLVKSGRLGEIRRFESRFTWWQPQAPEGWKAEAPVAEAGGILFDLGPHLIDQALQLFGPVVDVYAEIDTVREGVAADDDVFIALEHESGVRSHLWMSAVAPEPGPRFRVLGAEGTYVSWGLDGQETALVAGRRPGDPGFGERDQAEWGSITTGDNGESVPMTRGQYERFYAGVAASINSGSPVPVDPADAVAGLRVIAAARAAAASRTKK